MKNKLSPETKRKASFIVVLLKILELGSIFGLTFGIYYLGKFAEKAELAVGFGGTWTKGLFFLVMVALLLILSCLILYWIASFLIWFFKVNWRWAIMLSETQEEKMAREKFEEEEEEKRNLKKTESKKEDFVNEYGYWIGDKVRLVKKVEDGEEKYLHKIGTVKKIGFMYTYIKEWPDAYFMQDQLELVKPKRRKKK